MSAIKEVSINDLEGMKFNVIQSIYLNHSAKLNKTYFGLTETVPPVEYGADCKKYAWYETTLKGNEDYSHLQAFLSKLFGCNAPKIPTEYRKAKKVIDAFETALNKDSKNVDFGACHVNYMPIAPAFKAVNQ